MMRSSAGGMSARVPVEFRRILFEDRRHRVGGGVALERAPARQHFVEHRPEGKQIARVRRPSARGPARAPCSRPCPSPSPHRSRGEKIVASPVAPSLGALGAGRCAPDRSRGSSRGRRAAEKCCRASGRDGRALCRAPRPGRARSESRTPSPCGPTADPARDARAATRRRAVP